MQPKRKRLLQALEQISRWSCLAAGLAAIAMMVLVTTSVVARYALNSPIAFTEEVTGYLVAFVVFMGLGYTFRTGGHIRTDLILGRVSPGARRWLDILGALVALGWGALVLVAFAKRSYDYYLHGTRSFMELQTPLWIPSLFIVIGSALLVVEIIAFLMARLLSPDRGEDVIQ